MDSTPKPAFTPTQLAWAHTLPKTELHAHINGSVSFPDLRHLAHLTSRHFPTDAELGPQPGEPGFDLAHIFSLFGKEINGLVRDRPALEFVVQKAIDAFRADGCEYVELRTTPKETVEMSMDVYVETVLDVIRKDQDSHPGGMKVNLLLSIDRRHPASTSLRITHLALHHRLTSPHLIGLDVCGDPRAGGITPHLPALHLAKQEGLKLVIHFAEIETPPEVGEWEAMLSLDPDRLGHCIFVPEHLMDEIIARRIPIEICLTSNVLGGMVSTYATHHLVELWRRGYRDMILCTDDRGVFGSELSEEYLIAKEVLGLSEQEVETWCEDVKRFRYCL
ncbi:hypothetical protein HDU98_003759 [Podochytrium sp. JEL0797]|nr:hypothetical protein HDU98_003759 [Podochytrium sp. JEL0797]